MNNHVLIKGDPIQKEGTAAEALTPGELITFDENEKLIPHGNAGQNAQPRFVREAAFVGNDIDTDYEKDERVIYLVCRTGDEVQTFLAAGQNVSKDTPLISDGKGALKAYTAPTVDEAGDTEVTIYNDAIVAYAAEAKNNSAGEERVRIKVEVA